MMFYSEKFELSIEYDSNLLKTNRQISARYHTTITTVNINIINLPLRNLPRLVGKIIIS